MKIGIMATGGIAHTMADTIRRMPEVTLYAAASRSLDRAQAFQREYGLEKAYGSYEELAADDDIDLIYIATPHSHHFACMKLCIEHGRNVLCEKAFTVNAAEAREIARLAREKHVYVAEAIWTRYMPSRQIINDLLASGVIGEISMATANLSYDIDGNARIVDPELAGGALLDVGVYGLNFFSMHLGDGIERIEAPVQMNGRGVDVREVLTLFYRNGTVAVSTHGIFGRSDRHGVFYGEKGYIVVDNINDPLRVEVFDTNDVCVRRIDMPGQISGYEYQILEAKRCIEAGKTESESMPLAETVRMMEIMDGIRGQWGLAYPMEK